MKYRQKKELIVHMNNVCMRPVNEVKLENEDDKE